MTEAPKKRSRRYIPPRNSPLNDSEFLADMALGLKLAMTGTSKAHVIARLEQISKRLEVPLTEEDMDHNHAQRVRIRDLERELQTTRDMLDDATRRADAMERRLDAAEQGSFY